MAKLWTLGLLLASAAWAAPSESASVTFNKDVLPILQKQCQECHRPGEVAPMSFMTYEQTRPWAKAIKSAILTKKMPPWFADPRYGHFKNERRLTEAETKTIAAWADGGAPEGDPKDKPAPVRFTEGWSLGKPDIVVDFPNDIDIPATGLIDPSYMLVKVNFPKDLWVKAAEIRPGNSRVVHHMKAWVRPPGSTWMTGVPDGVTIVPQPGQFSSARSDTARPDILAKYNPGLKAQEFTIGGAAKLIPAGSDIVFEIHYTTTGKPEKDRSRVGIVLADAPPRKRYVTTTAVSSTDFLIPARARNFEVKAEATLDHEVQLVWVQPHMHLRATDYELRAHYPSGESQMLMKVKFDFNWQLGYEFAKPIALPKGTRLEALSSYDNSENNPYNPNPNVDLRYGLQTEDEMATSFMGFITDLDVDPFQVLPRRGRVVKPETAKNTN
jgi:hypothetical protein